MRDDSDLLRETARVNYRLRSTFFLRRLKEYNTLTFPGQISSLIPFAEDYDWEQRQHWGIGEDAFAFIAESSLA